MKIMAVDFGDARTGLAICDRGELLASPAGVIQEKHFPTTVQKVAPVSYTHLTLPTICSV